MNWSPEQYGKFEVERNRPIRDLLSQVPDGVRHVADLGCGPGNSTELLFQRFPNAKIIGIDNSPDMIRAARQRLPRVRFDLADIALWPDDGPFDLIFSNAALQWVPDHPVLLPFLVSKLSPGGTLAVQMPDNLDEPAHRLMREVATSGPWAAKLTAASQARESRHNADWYFTELTSLGLSVNVWRTTYYHPLRGVEGIVEWFKGTGMRPFLQPLDDAEREAFLARYSESLREVFPLYSDGTVLLPFPRLFFVTTRE